MTTTTDRSTSLRQGSHLPPPLAETEAYVVRKEGPQRRPCLSSRGSNGIRWVHFSQKTVNELILIARNGPIPSTVYSLKKSGGVEKWTSSSFRKSR